MSGQFFDDEGNVGFSIGDDMGINSNGDPIIKIGKNFGVNTRTGKTSFLFGFTDSDDEED